MERAKWKNYFYKWLFWYFTQWSSWSSFSAANLGKLIVALNSDSSVKKLKGKSRPINNEMIEKIFILF